MKTSLITQLIGSPRHERSMTIHSPKYCDRKCGWKAVSQYEKNEPMTGDQRSDINQLIAIKVASRRTKRIDKTIDYCLS